MVYQELVLTSKEYMRVVGAGPSPLPACQQQQPCLQAARCTALAAQPLIRHRIQPSATPPHPPILWVGKRFQPRGSFKAHPPILSPVTPSEPQVSEIQSAWLVEIAPHMYSSKDILEDGRKLPKGKGRAGMDKLPGAG